MVLIQNATVHQGITAGNHTNVIMRKEANEQTGQRIESPLYEGSKAAVFNRSTMVDYAGKNLNPVQKGIMELQKQMENIQDNENIDKETKETLLESLKDQLENLQKQLVDPEQKDEAVKKGKQGQAFTGEAENPQADGEASMAFFIGAGTNLKQVKTVENLETKARSKADLAQAELDYAMHHPGVALQLKDEDIIERRKNEIQELEDVAKNLRDLKAKTSSNADSMKNLQQSHEQIKVNEEDQSVLGQKNQLVVNSGS